ncbi:MAG TPA: HAMP domain-containing sensor histidine kinase [Gemmataceae bacterium]|nr:HAMP domain-containing sensor histidine kinase [Gemmataceae bacterium]
MRWRIRSQLLLPLLLLLLGVLGLSVWMAFAAANHARQQIETRVRDVAHLLSEGKFPLAPLSRNHILLWVKQLSGADYLLVQQNGKRISTLEVEPERLPPPEDVSDDWRTLRLGPPLRADGAAYLCSGIRLRRGHSSGDVLYILYPESLWKDALWEAIWPFLILGGSVGAASLALAVGLGQGLSRRIRELERRTRGIADGVFSPLPLPRRNDEIRDLARSINDLAERLAQFQETTQRSERLRLLGQVSGGLAHQLRNGLTGVRLAVQLFVRECAAQTDTAALDVALRQLTLLETNLKRFLDLGRESDGRRERCSLPALIDEAVELLRPQCRHAGIDLRWQPLSGGTGGTGVSPVGGTGVSPVGGTGVSPVLGDAGRLGQLILNVLGNAVEAAGPGGTVQIKLRNEKRLAPQSMIVVLEVLDSGPGPKPEVADRLFEPFVTGKPEGVGLGLAVARQIVEAHGGNIRWSRQEGWTCFRIELPLE